MKVNSHASDLGLRAGDKIVKVNQETPTTPDAVRKAVDNAKKQGRTAVLLQVERNNQRFFVGVPLAAN